MTSPARPKVDPERLDAVAEAVLASTRAPAVGLAVVAADRVLLQRGYGVRDLSTGAPFTAATLYPIASTTKAMNATVIGMLVDDGLLEWDVPVRRYLPEFALADPLRSGSVTLRDLLAMRTGFPRHDWAWAANAIDRAELLRRAHHLDLSAEFRVRFQYSNISATIAGHVAETVADQSWESLLEGRLLAPLGMDHTRTLVSDHGELVRSYHENAARQLVPCDHQYYPSTAPSGGTVCSTLRDMARWARFNLAGGVIDDRRLISEAALAQLQSAQMVVGAGLGQPVPNTTTYGLGWILDHYRGSRRIAHGGFLNDVQSEIALFPEHGLGLVSVVPFGGPFLAGLVNEHALDALLGRAPARKLSDVADLYETAIEDRRALNDRAHRVPDAPASHPLGDYAGTYVHAGYGRFDVVLDEAGLTLCIEGLRVPLRHWHYDAWVAAPDDRFPIHAPHIFEPVSRFLFETDAEGAIASLTLHPEAATAPVRLWKQERGHP